MKGADLPLMQTVVQNKFDGLPSDLDRQISGFLGELISENLVVECSDDTALAAGEPDASPRTPYEAPGVDKFDDMAMMLALDPPMPELPAGLAGRVSAKKI